MAMRRLSLASVESCITAAYQRFVPRTQGNFNVATANGNVGVTVVLNNGLWNCGFPGFYLAEGDVNALRNWCINNPGNGHSFGFRGHDAGHPNTVNIIYMSDIMFNFHVNTAN
eukprot:gene4528-4854_t